MCPKRLVLGCRRPEVGFPQPSRNFIFQHITSVEFCSAIAGSSVQFIAGKTVLGLSGDLTGLRTDPWKARIGGHTGIGPSVKTCAWKKRGIGQLLFRVSNVISTLWHWIHRRSAVELVPFHTSPTWRDSLFNKFWGNSKLLAAHQVLTILRLLGLQAKLAHRSTSHGDFEKAGEYVDESETAVSPPHLQIKSRLDRKSGLCAECGTTRSWKFRSTGRNEFQ